ncbi:MAG: methyltransferase regulatory domain-containing protein [Bdellovibrionales bacterium]
MDPYIEFSPVPLSYVAALRGVLPRRPGEPFAYAEVAVTDPGRLICLAASNPEGHFFGVTSRADIKDEGERIAREREVKNISFIQGNPGEILTQCENSAALLPSLHYLCCDERTQDFPASERAALFALAEKILLPGGLFCYGYRAYAEPDGALRFLVRECAPQMDVAQAKVFLDELKRLGPHYFRNHPATAAALDQAIAAGMPDRFFSSYDDGAARSGSFDAILALRPRGFSYAGDADIGKNYVELTTPASAHQVIIDCEKSHLYEAVKDFAINRQERCDIWYRQAAPRSHSVPELFGSFVYGSIMPRSDIPARIETAGPAIDLKTPLFDRLVNLMTLTPLSIGDFLAHPDGKGFAPADVVGAIHVLVACGIAKPMRGHYRGQRMSDMSQPRFAGAFNQYVDKMPVTGAPVWLASPMAGSAMAVSARDALVMQALNRAGLADSVSALLPELERLAQNPAAAARVMDVTIPTPELATNMIKDSVSQSIVQWYAYGLLAAA